MTTNPGISEHDRAILENGVGPKQVSKRYRIAVSTSVKGVKTWDCTVEMEGASMEDVLEQSDMLVRILDLRYPPQVN